MSDWRYHKITRETAEKYEIPGREVTYFLSTAAETDGKVTVMDSYFPRLGHRYHPCRWPDCRQVPWGTKWPRRWQRHPP